MEYLLVAAWDNREEIHVVVRPPLKSSSWHGEGD